MSIFDDLKAKADLNSDGKLSKEDIDSLKEKGLTQDVIGKLKGLADQNDDGKINLDDIKNSGLTDLQDKLTGLFK